MHYCIYKSIQTQSDSNKKKNNDKMQTWILIYAGEHACLYRGYDVCYTAHREGICMSQC